MVFRVSWPIAPNGSKDLITVALGPIGGPCLVGKDAVGDRLGRMVVPWLEFTLRIRLIFDVMDERDPFHAAFLLSDYPRTSCAITVNVNFV